MQKLSSTFYVTIHVPYRERLAHCFQLLFTLHTHKSCLESCRGWSGKWNAFLMVVDWIAGCWCQGTGWSASDWAMLRSKVNILLTSQDWPISITQLNSTYIHVPPIHHHHHTVVYQLQSSHTIS